MFLPMAIDAHELAKPLSSDAAFHLSSLQRMALRNDEALASAQEALVVDPNHLLLLYTAGEAARAAGQAELANQFAARLLEVWDEETARAREEYGMHQGMMEDIRAFAESGG
jgi:tetratricopeptide (TPR) repeat protein